MRAGGGGGGPWRIPDARARNARAREFGACRFRAPPPTESAIPGNPQNPLESNY